MALPWPAPVRLPLVVQAAVARGVSQDFGKLARVAMALAVTLFRAAAMQPMQARDLQ